MGRWSYRRLREIVRAWPCMRYGRDPCYWLAAVAYVALGMLASVMQWLTIFAIFFTLVGGARVFVRGLEIRSEGSTRIVAALSIVPLFLVHEGAAYLIGLINKRYPHSEE